MLIEFYFIFYNLWFKQYLFLDQIKSRKFVSFNQILTFFQKKVLFKPTITTKQSKFTPEVFLQISSFLQKIRNV